MIPSGIAPLFTVIIGRLLLLLDMWIAFAMTSLPTPLSPVISTVISVGAT